mmetsp:Transcript_49454/g.159849  ORF Transcript_49454/g.159849 Transcript_49454/m.159849 type:complete len:295 (-) Transcript_49454:201-1085(-)
MPRAPPPRAAPRAAPLPAAPLRRGGRPRRGPRRGFGRAPTGGSMAPPAPSCSRAHRACAGGCTRGRTRYEEGSAMRCVPPATGRTGPTRAAERGGAAAPPSLPRVRWRPRGATPEALPHSRPRRRRRGSARAARRPSSRSTRWTTRQTRRARRARRASSATARRARLAASCWIRAASEAPSTRGQCCAGRMRLSTRRSWRTRRPKRRVARWAGRRQRPSTRRGAWRRSQSRERSRRRPVVAAPSRRRRRRRALQPWVPRRVRGCRRLHGRREGRRRSPPPAAPCGPSPSSHRMR